MFNVGLSLNNFILINTIGFIAVVAISILYSLNKVNNFVIAALGTLFIVNGIVHTMASVLTGTYSPGTLSGIVIYIPLVLTIFPFSSSGKRLASILAGIFI